MWHGILPAVTTKFTETGELDFREMERCFALQIDAGVDGLIACGSFGEGPLLNHDERIDVFKLVQQVSEDVRHCLLWRKRVPATPVG